MKLKSAAVLALTLGEPSFQGCLSEDLLTIPPEAMNKGDPFSAFPAVSEPQAYALASAGLGSRVVSNNRSADRAFIANRQKTSLC